MPAAAAATIAFVIGLLVGATLGMVLMACLCAAGRTGDDDVSTD